MENEVEKVRTIAMDIVKQMVSVPENVNIATREDVDDEGNDVTILTITADPKDVGVLIGRKGENATAIRKVVGVIAFQLVNKRVYVQIDAPRKSYAV